MFDLNKELTPEERLQELHRHAYGVFTDAYSVWKVIIDEARDDLKFFSGKHFTETEEQTAESSKQPLLKVHVLPQMTGQIEAGLRSKSMGITVSPTDTSGSNETAAILGGLIRQIEANSKARAHYLRTAGRQGALVPGWGVLKVEVDYDETSDPYAESAFDLTPRITSAADPFKCFPDPLFQDPAAADANYWIEMTTMSQRDYERKYPDAQLASVIDEVSNSVTIVRLWYYEEVVKYTYLIADNRKGRGAMVVRDEMVQNVVDDPEKFGAYLAEMKDGQKKILLRRREVTERNVRWVDMNSVEVLDEGDFPASKLPFSLVASNVWRHDNELEVYGCVRHATDSQKLFSYLATSIARRVGSANKSPWLVDMRSIARYKRIWDRANKDAPAYLPFDAYSDDNMEKANPKPERADQTAQIIDLVQAMTTVMDNIKSTVGVFDAGMGATEAQQSGVAVKTLAQQGRESNGSYSEALQSAVEHLGCILLDIIQRVYDTERVITILQPDNKQKLVEINKVFNKDGKDMAYELTKGRYNVKVNPGPGHATAQAEVVNQLNGLVQTNPTLGPVVQDIVVENMDFAGKDRLAKRLAKLMAIQFPQLVEDEDGLEIPPQVQAQFAQLKAQFEQAQLIIQQQAQQLQQAQFVINSQQAKTEGDLRVKTAEHEMSLERLNAQAQLQAKAELTRAERDDMNDRSQRELAEIQARVKHSENMMKLLIDAVSKLGPDGAALALSMGNDLQDGIYDGDVSLQGQPPMMMEQPYVDSVPPQPEQLPPEME